MLMAQFKSIKSNRYVSLRKFDRWSLFWPVSIQSETNRTTRWRQANQVANEAFSGSVATLLIRRLINSEKMVSHRHATTRQMSSKVKLSASCWIRSILFFNKIRKTVIFSEKIPEARTPPFLFCSGRPHILRFPFPLGRFISFNRLTPFV